MAAFKPGRLRRILDPIIGNQQLFSLHHDDLQENDDTITSIAITRGTSSGRHTGHQPTTCEVGVVGRRDILQVGEEMSITLNNAPATHLANFLGSSSATDIMHRFHGRLATVTVDELGGTNYTTSLAASGWLTQMNYSRRTSQPASGDPLDSIIYRATDAENPRRRIDIVTMLGDTDTLLYQPPDEPQTFRDLQGDYINDVGLLIQERRDGTYRAWSHITREALAANNRYQFPLMRSQAIAPGTYRQDSSTPPKRVEYLVRNEDGTVVRRAVNAPNHNNELREVETVDWERWQVTEQDNQLMREAKARAYENSQRLYTLPTIQVDILLLLQQNTEYTLQIAQQLLTMEVGQPVYLAGDWSNRIRGVHFAEGIQETINPDEWLFQLSLVPQLSAIGSVALPVEPVAWDSHLGQWDEEPRPWNGA